MVVRENLHRFTESIFDTAANERVYLVLIILKISALYAVSAIANCTKSQFDKIFSINLS
ncbi:hypothetical protein [Nostoc sp.]|uniref:hypothetical protein n=1 Tax=Nostoc sp. TaxID=1180 RepID=UPI002FF8E58A